MICVLGATGQVGLPLIQQLSRDGHRVRALAHSQQGAAKLKFPGVEAVVGDIWDDATLAGVLAETDQLFLLTPNSPEQLDLQNRIVDHAVKAKVEGIVKLSVFTAEENELCHFSRLHWANERYVEKSGIPYTFLHPNTFMQSLGLLFGEEIRRSGTMSSAVGPDKTITMVDVRDVAAVSAAVLARGDNRGETLRIMGPERVSYSECAKRISERIGKPITYRQISERESITVLLRAGVPEWMMEGIKDLYRMYDRNDINPFSDVTQRLTGQPPRTFSNFLDDYAHLFS